jgi:anti-anti-sigma factor
VEDGPGVFRLFGEFDLAAVREARERFVGATGDVELDCSGVTFIDAAGLGLFAAVHTACESRGGKLVIVNASRCVIRLLQMTDLVTVLVVHAELPAR